MKKTMGITRRDFLRLAGVAALDLFLLAIGGVGYGFLMEPNSFKLETVRLKLTRLARSFSGFRLAQISDLHMGGWMDAARLQHVVDLVIEQKPDTLLITGDFLIGHGNVQISDQMVKDLIEQLSRLSSSIPSFAVLGNHDYWTNVETVRHVIASSGITDLTNAVSTVKRG
ncbi:MAG TPA: metallophosphoesterase, partial [Anaerolineales bacterium]|nr:metallophosphoesterase [Anaerolineales bacterium]